jgi:hypothetical protein
MARERFVGGASLPSKRWSRINATVPLAVLTVNDAGLALRLRGRLGRSLETQLVVGFTEIASAYPLRGRIYGAGLGLDLVGGNFAFFYCWRHRQEVLDALGAHGVPLTTGREVRSVDGSV